MDDTPKQDQLSPEQVIKDLTSDLKTSVSGLTAQGKPAAWNHNGNSRPLNHRRDKDGAYVIIYTLGAPFPFYSHSTKNIRPLDPHHVNALLHAMKEIEAVANIRFEPVTDPTLFANADLRLFQSDFTGSKYEPFTGYTISNTTYITNDIVISDRLTKEKFDFGDVGYNAILHEMLHTLGLSHPGANGSSIENANAKNPLYTIDSTIMSALISKPNGITVQSLGPYDVAALQFLYGKPKKIGKNLVPAEQLTNTGLLYAETPLTLDFRDFNTSGELRMDLSTRVFKDQLRGKLNNHVVAARFALGTRIKDVLSNNNNSVRLRIKGNDLPNRLQGGSGHDELTAQHGADTLTGGDGEDWFIFDDKSGLKNRVTDYQGDGNPMDALVVDGGIAHVALRPVKEPVTSDMPGSHTDALFFDAARRLVASGTALNTTPEKIRILYTEKNPPPSTEIIPAAPADMPPARTSQRKR